MNRKIFALFALTAGMHLAVHASENVNTTENRQFLKQQETKLDANVRSCAPVRARLVREPYRRI